MRLTPDMGTVGHIDLAAVDLYDPELYQTGDPHVIWTVMRAEAPLHHQRLADGREFWSVTRHADVCRVLGDHRAFTSERGTVITQLGEDDLASGQLLTSCDPPRHTDVRRPINGRLNARSLVEWEDRIRAAVLGFLAPAAEKTAWDLAAQAYFLPMIVAGALLGVGELDWADLVRWTAMAAAPTDPEFRIGGVTQTLTVAHHQIFEYFAGQLRARRESDSVANDLISHLLTMSVADARLSDTEIVYNAYSLLLGANATTPHTVSGTVLTLAQDPALFAELRADRGLLAGLVEEGLRWTSAANNFMRYATAATELSGGVVAPGNAVVAWIGAANRDERVFAEPHRFDVHRSDNRHIAFGFGPHYCIGASLARLTFRVFFEEFVERFEGVELAGEPVHLRSSFIAGMTHLPIACRLAR